MLNREDIILMAREAGWKDLPTVRLAFAGFDLARFAALVAAQEREACAKVCYELPWKDMDCIPSNLAFAAAIRARGQNE
jgi:hypothetical protein